MQIQDKEEGFLSYLVVVLPRGMDTSDGVAVSGPDGACGGSSG
jgi:hypothetical protein